MSYLEKKDGNPSFTEAIISFWFRVPSESLDKVIYDNNVNPSPPFNGVLPLLVMGPEGMLENKYDLNPEKALYMKVEFTNEGPFYDYSAEYLGEECTAYHDFTFAGTAFHCCLVGLRRTMYTAVQIAPGPEPGEEVTHNDIYKLIFNPTPPNPPPPANPTCIGVDDNGYLYVNFQTNQQPTITRQGEFEVVTSITPGENISTSGNLGYKSGMETTTVHYNGGLLGCVGLVEFSSTEGPEVVEGHSGSGTYTQAEEHKSTFPELPFETGKFYSGGPEGRWYNNIKVSPDVWHHVLVSVKLQDTKSHSVTFEEAHNSMYGYDGGSLLYIALDDVNYTKDDLSGMWGWGGKEGRIKPNEVFPDQGWDIATDHYNPDTNPPGVQETYSLLAPEVPAGIIGIPAHSKYVKDIHQVEMAELQIWFGQSMDTAKQSNRRLFIGKDGKPMDMEKAEEALGKPQISLHGSNNWKNGINKGTLAPPPSKDGEPVPWLTPFPAKGGIDTWKPDPSLYGEQSPP